LIDPPPIAYEFYPTIERIYQIDIYIKGCSSAITKYTGNIHGLITDFRQYFYF